MTRDSNTNKTNSNTTDTNPTETPYNEKEIDHLCDQAIDYNESTLTIDFTTDNWDTATFTGTCKHCGRKLLIDMSIDVEMLRTRDAESNETLHHY